MQLLAAFSSRQCEMHVIAVLIGNLVSTCPPPPLFTALALRMVPLRTK